MKFKLIQIFRGIAAMLVVMHHLIANSNTYFGFPALNNFFKFGLIGVDFFFVLSGFIITYVHLQDVESKGNWRTFFKKRFIRIYPIYWVAATLSLVIYTLITPVFLKELGLSMDYGNPVISRWVIESYLLIPQPVMRLVGISWTLCYEVLFYLVFGLCIIGGSRTAKAALGIWVASILANVFFIQTPNFYLDFLVNPLILEFLFGCLVGYLIRRNHLISFKVLWPVLIFCVMILASKMKIVGLVYHRTLTDIFLLALGFATLIYMTVKFDQKNPANCYPKLLLLIGDASYSIYLFHNIFLSGLCRTYLAVSSRLHLSINLQVVCLMIFAGTVGLGILVHLLIEKNLIRYLNGLILKRKEKVQIS